MNDPIRFRFDFCPYDRPSDRPWGLPRNRSYDRPRDTPEASRHAVR